jgi:hypothetical protein
MRREKIYEFQIDRALNKTRRKALESNIERNASLAPRDFEYGWDEANEDLLHIDIAPVHVEIGFQSDKVELFLTAPLWARAALTKQKRTQLRDLVEKILVDSKFIFTKPSVSKAQHIS